MLPKKQKMSNIFFHMDVTLTDELTLQGCEWSGMFGIQTCQKPEPCFEICLGSSKFAEDSFLEFELYKTSCTPVNSILHTTLNFKGQVT